jgi:2'-hydroxyisoflavone reductase
MAMNILIIGGTRFLGRHIVSSLIQEGHQITLFNRGNNTDVFPDIKQISGDRDWGFSDLKNETYDVVIDTCCYFPHQMKTAMKAFSKRCKQYIFISSVSAYRDFKIEKIDESYPVAMYHDIDSVTEITGETYGPLKAACEKVLTDNHPNALIVRPGFIVGPWDNTGRFTWWTVRVAKGGTIPIPGSSHDPIQFIDVRDLSNWITLSITKNLKGIYNLVGPKNKISLTEFVELCSEACQTVVDYQLIPEPVLKRENALYSFPIWCPSSNDAHKYMSSICNIKALNSGLRFRNVKTTVSDTLDWWQSQGSDSSTLSGPDENVEYRLFQGVQRFINELIEHGEDHPELTKEEARLLMDLLDGTQKTPENVSSSKLASVLKDIDKF